MWPSANSAARCVDADFVIVGSPASRRTELFQAALRGLKLRPALVVSYLDLLSGRAHLTDVVRPGACVRLESPHKDFDVERAFLAAGADEEGDFARLPRRAAEALRFEPGLILYPRQWYLGFRRTLEEIERQLRACAPHRLMNSPADIAAMFDKPRCHQMLAARGTPVPHGLGVVRSFDQLSERMRRDGCGRVFVKLAHGSSASGAVAYRTDGRRHAASTTVEVVRRGGEVRLYNSRRVRTISDVREIARLIDSLCRHRAHVERWVPKAGFAGRTFDLRVVVIGARARHVVVRTSRSPFTNLHLLNERGDAEGVRARAGRDNWEAARQTCESAVASCFPDSLYAGVDLLLAPGYRERRVLEVNAFGDLLPGVLCDGLDTYTAEVLALAGGARPTRSRVRKCPRT